MSPNTRVVLALVVGLAGGALLAAAKSPALSQIAPILAPVGVLWLNALRMTVVPLVIALLITGIASAAESAGTGRLAASTMLLFVAFLTGAALLAAVLTPAVLAWWPVSTDAAASLRAGLSHAGTIIPSPPPLGEWITSLVPTNPFQAAAEGAMLPLVVFALLFGFAASRIDTALRAQLLGFFQAVVATMLVLIRWILWAAPVGVFALALGVGFRGGIDAAGALGYYLILMCTLCVIVTVALYPIVVCFGGVPLARFLRAAAPAQVVAISTQSSLAALPAMIAGAQADLGTPSRVTALVLPLAVSLFRITSPLLNLSIVVFVAHIYGVHLDAVRLAAGIGVAVVTSFGVVSLPSQITFFTTTVPISLAMGVPTELLSLLIAIEVIPDIFRTIGNVTADLAVTTIVAQTVAGRA
jgi:proton glutamate symport protein